VAFCEYSVICNLHAMRRTQAQVNGAGEGAARQTATEGTIAQLLGVNASLVAVNATLLREARVAWKRGVGGGIGNFFTKKN
jgi:hypothetical protein